MSTDQSIPGTRPPLTKRQCIALWAILAAFGCVMSVGWYWMTMPSVYEQAFDGTVLGRSFSSVRFWHGKPDARPEVPGWNMTYSYFAGIDYEHVAALKVDATGRIVECACYFVNTDVPEDYTFEEKSRHVLSR